MSTEAQDADRLYALDVEPASAAPLTTETACPVCGDTRARPAFRIDLLPAPIVVCETCGHGRFEPMPALEEVAGFYPAAYYGEPGTKFHPLVEGMVRFVGRRQVRFLTRGLARGDRVLDVGCGRGVLLRPLADLGFEVHGVEISKEATRGADPRAQIRIAPDLAEAGYTTGFFQQIVIWHVLEHLVDPQRTLAEAHRILTRYGRLVVAVPNFSSLQARSFGADWFHLDLPRHLHHFPMEALRRLLEKTGFEVESEHHFSLRQNPFGWIQSIQNRAPQLPRNGLYRLLHRRGSDQRLFTPAVRGLLYGSAVMLAPSAVGASMLAAWMKRGATVHVVARKA